MARVNQGQEINGKRNWHTVVTTNVKLERLTFSISLSIDQGSDTSSFFLSRLFELNWHILISCYGIFFNNFERSKKNWNDFIFVPL